ncbi:MAG: hypothetical protein COA99_08495 [Moraxellaceae bacterium]|nr:MAG: hypothetical protein COA99_08495 [Moraxellaceae bacterium]
MSSSIRSAFSIPKNLRAIFTQPADNFAAIDGLRALSLLMVILFHVFRNTSHALTKGQTQDLISDTPLYLSWVWNADKGVDIFFLISGFLIAGLLFREHQDKARIDLKSFYIRRLLRLSPIYLVALGLYWLAGAHNAENVWANALYVNNFLPLKEQAFTWGWSLAVEEQFYILFPMFLLVFFFPSKHRLFWLMALFASSFVIRTAFIYTDEMIWHVSTYEIFFNKETFYYVFGTVYDNLYTRYGTFLCGIIAAYLHYYRQDWLKGFFAKPLQSITSTVAALTTIGFFMFFPISDATLNADPTFDSLYFALHRNLFGMALAWLVLACIHSKDMLARIVNKFLSLRLWHPIAQLSYSGYLVHYVIAEIVLLSLKANMEARDMVFANVDISWLIGCFVIITIVSLMLATVAYLLIEKPFMNLRSGYRANLVSKSTR